MSTPSRIARRTFLRKTAAAAAAALGAPLVIPSSVLGGPSRAAPSDRIVVGWIGTGDRGTEVMNQFLGERDVQVAAACDVKRWRLEKAKYRVDTLQGKDGCAVYRDFRELTARKDIEAVLVSSCDHWHVLHSLAAVRSGKDVYCEKPMGLCMAECTALKDAVHRHGRVFQFGTQQRSEGSFRLACELARNETMGKLHTINVWSPGSSSGGPTEAAPPPEGLDYDLWLGQAPFTAHTKDRTTNDWWWFISDYALGFIAGWGIHPLDIAAWGAGEKIDGPVEVEGKGDFPAGGVCDTATNWKVQLRFAGGLRVNFTGWPMPEEWTKRYPRHTSHGTVFEGSEGWVHVDRERIDSSPAGLVKTQLDSNAVRLYRSEGHVRNFLDCVRSRKETVCDIDQAVRSETLCQVSEIAIRLGRKVTWDVRTGSFKGDEEANRRLVRPMRAPWSLSGA